MYSLTTSDTRTDTHTADDDSTADGGTAVLLHVEPDAHSTELLAAFAERLADGLTVRSVDGVEAALDALDALDAVDCVVTEQQLPDGFGVEVVERLRERGNDVPVVFHTTCSEDETQRRALEAGANAYFSKRLERGQYDRILARVLDLVGDDARRPGTAPTNSPDASASSAGAPPSEE